MYKTPFYICNSNENPHSNKEETFPLRGKRQLDQISRSLLTIIIR